MTCIVGFTDKKNNVTWMGGDSLGSNGYTQAVNLAGKVFHNDVLNNIVIGGTSTFRHLDLLKYSKNLFPMPEHTGGDEDIFCNPTELKESFPEE